MSRLKPSTQTGATPRRKPWGLIGLWGGVGFLAVMVLFSFVSEAAQKDALVLTGWPVPLSETIVRNRGMALSHALVMGVLAVSFFTWIARRNPGRTARQRAAWILVAVVALDAAWLSRRYVETLPRSFIEKNAVTDVLKERLGEGRLAMTTQDGFYNVWLTYLLPYHDIRTFNYTQMPRMPADYLRFLQALSGQTIRLWQLGAISYVLTPGDGLKRMQNDPQFTNLFDVALGFRVFQTRDGGIGVAKSDSGLGPEHALLRFVPPAPRVTLLGAWEACTEEEILRRLADPSWPLFQRALFAPDASVDLLPMEHDGPVGEVQILELRSGFYRLRVHTGHPAILRLSDRFTSSWEARVNGQKHLLRRCDFLFLGLALDPGEHDVVVRYSPSKGSLYVLFTALGIFCGIVLWGMWTSTKQRPRRAT